MNEKQYEESLQELHRRFPRATPEHIQLTFAFRQRDLDETIAALLQEGGYDYDEKAVRDSNNDDDDDALLVDYDDDVTDSESDEDEEESMREPLQQHNCVIKKLIESGMAFAASKGSMNDILLGLSSQFQRQSEADEANKISSADSHAIKVSTVIIVSAEAYRQLVELISLGKHC